MRQFSLSALLLFVLASGVLFGIWRAFGTSVFLGLLFATLSVAPVVALQRPWNRAYVFAWAAVYVPFVVMATYTLLYVSCSHCRATVWTVLPFAPALLLVDMAHRVLNLPRPSDTIWFAVALVLSATMVTALSWLLRKNGWWRWALAATALAYSACAAIATLALIRA